MITGVAVEHSFRKHTRTFVNTLADVDGKNVKKYINVLLTLKTLSVASGLNIAIYLI